MYDSGKIIIGLVIFVGFMTFPIWYTAGKAAPIPQPELPKQGKCVESKAFMRAAHMQLLLDWRDQALREGNRWYVNKRGEKVWISLQNSCMKCHPNKDKFCDRCHTYVSVKPYCWDCHYTPKESKKWASTEGNS